MSRSAARTGVAALVTAFLVAGAAACGSPDEPAASEPAAEPSPDRAVACSLLDAEQRAELVGERVDEVTDPALSDLGLQCRWGDNVTFVEVSSLDAGAWARSLPGLIDSLRGSGRPISPEDDAELTRLTALVDGRETLTAVDACELFAPLAQAIGAEPVDGEVVAFLPLGSGTGVQAQTCTDGVFTSVVFSAD